MKFGLPISFALHGMAVFGGALLWSQTSVELSDVRIIPLKIVTVSDVTNIKPTRIPVREDTQKTPVQQFEIPEPDVEKIASAEPISPPEPEKSIKPVEKPPIVLKPSPNAVKPTPEPAPEPEPAPPAFDLDAFSNMVDKARTSKPSANTQKVLTSEAELAKYTQNGSGAKDGQTVNPSDYIKAKMEPCWHIDAGVKDYQNLRVEVLLTLDADGEVSALNIRNSAQIIASGNTAWRTAQENVVSALNGCAPYGGLLSLEHDKWKTMKLNFQPGDI